MKQMKTSEIEILRKMRKQKNYYYLIIRSFILLTNFYTFLFVCLVSDLGTCLNCTFIFNFIYLLLQKNSLKNLPEENDNSNTTVAGNSESDCLMSNNFEKS